MSSTHKNPGVASVLSLLIPGVGQFYNGDFWRGLFWLIITPGLWIGSGGLLGWICHVIAAITAYTRAGRFNRLAGPLVLLALASPAAAGSQALPPANWLDRPLAGWNTPGGAVSKAPRADESREETMKRCQLPPLRSTPAERALADAGWIPFHNLDQQLVRDDVEIVGAMTRADAMCRPGGYNLFVFVGGLFAGTLSPTLMDSRADGSSGVVRLIPDNTITTDFSRYRDSDALCCPSSHVSIRYRIDRSVEPPVVVATEQRQRP